MFQRKTYVETIEDHLTIVFQNLNEYRLHGTTEEDLRNHNVVLGAQLEIFLRKIVFAHLKNPSGLSFLVNELLTLGYPQSTIDSLHTLRESYNSSKHDANFSPSIKNTSDNLESFRLFINETKKDYATKIATLSTLPPLNLKSTYWGFAWDHYTGGDTEISIFIPAYDEEHPLAVPSIDTIYIRMDKWDAFKTDIQNFGNFTTEKGSIANVPLYDFMAGEGDFLSSFSFEGKFKDLIKSLSKYELRQDLIPGLNRADNHFVIEQSVILSTIEAIRTFKTFPSDEILTKRILGMSKSLFAVPENHPSAITCAGVMLSLLHSIPFDSWITVDGPIWMKYTDFNTLASILIYHNENIGLRNDFVLIIGF